MSSNLDSSKNKCLVENLLNISSLLFHGIVAWKSSHACEETKLTEWIGQCKWDRKTD